MLVTPAGIVMEVKPVLWNAVRPMLVNWDPASNVTELKLVAPLNAYSPMLLTLSGMLIDVKPDA